jgi:HK97 family phage major capsid protein
MADYKEDLLHEVKGIVDKQRALAEKVGVDAAEYKTFMDNVDKKMAEFDKKNEELIVKQAADEKAADELKERIKHLELVGANSQKAQNPETAIKDIEDVMNAMLKNQWSMFINDESNYQKAQNVISTMTKQNYDYSEGGEKMKQLLTQVKASPDLLRSDIGELGGFLCPPEYSSVLEKNMIEYSPIRQFCRIKRTSSKVYKEPIRIGIPRATRPGEAREGGTSTSTYGQEDYTPIRLTNTTPVTLDELAFNAYNLANELIIDNSEAFAVQEGIEFVSGTGVEQGLGFAVDPNVPQFATATSTLTFDDMINITGELKAGYNPMYFFNRRTMAYLRQLKDAVSGRYLWTGPWGDAAAAAAPLINGFRYSSSFIDMDDYNVASGFPVLFADMSRFYQIVDRTDITIIRDEYTRKKEGIVEYTMNKWCFGKPKIKEAGIRMLLTP